MNNCLVSLSLSQDCGKVIFAPSPEGYAGTVRPGPDGAPYLESGVGDGVRLIVGCTDQTVTPEVSMDAAYNEDFELVDGARMPANKYLKVTANYDIVTSVEYVVVVYVSCNSKYLTFIYSLSTLIGLSSWCDGYH